MSYNTKKGGVFMMEKVIHVLQDHIVIPKLLLVHYKQLKMDEKETILMIYLMQEQYGSFNPKKISTDLSFSLAEIMAMIDHLATEGLLEIETKKINNVREEFLNMECLYKKLAYYVMNEELEEEEKTNLYSLFEQEFGRPLSPIEYEIIHGWIDGGYQEETILMALKEATFNGVSNLRYIDKILYEWKKKGISTKEQIEQGRAQFQTKKVEKKELFDYDWLNDTDE